jgi:2-C-methyl-D-erythritol 4-phosphate cytidylyltransferase
MANGMLTRMIVRTAALIPAAGKGERLGLGPKAFLKLGEHSLLKHVLLAFEEEVDELLIAVSEDMLANVAEHTTPRTRVVLGGQTRQETVHKLLKETKAERVLIHDAARPFLSHQIIQDCLKSLDHVQAVTVAKAVADTLIKRDSGEVIDRSALLAVQTPQAFDRLLILAAHDKAQSEAVMATDDAALVRHLGIDVAVVEGSAWLMKITTPPDFEIAKALAPVWSQIQK